MVAVEAISVKDQGQIERAECARDAWRNGDLDRAELLIDSLLIEDMSASVSAKCYSVKAGVALARKDALAAMSALSKMAPFLEAADIRIQGTFFNHRGRAHRMLGEIDAALTDYSGSLALWQMCGDKNYEGAAYINIAECYFRLNDLEQAYFNIELAFVVLPEASEYLCNAYDTKAKILLADGRAENAYRLIERALALSGGNELWEKEFIETREKIKQRLVEMLAPLAKLEDLEDLKLLMVRHALDKSEGSVKRAARMLGTSRQLVTYTADSHGIGRSRRKKSIIKLSP